ncbi:MAG: hypothetical protein ACYCQI_00005 [Gammaproteobacteria bacterium]
MFLRSAMTFFAKQPIAIKLPEITRPVEDIILQYTDLDFSFQSDRTRYSDGLFLFSEKDRLPEIVTCHVLNCKEPKELETLLEKNPSLLLQSIDAVTPAGQLVSKTLYQMAIGNYDTEMANMIEQLLLKHYSQSVVDEQRSGQYPKDWKAEHEAKLAEFKTKIIEVIKAFKSAKSIKENVRGDYNPRYIKLAEELNPVIENFEEYLRIQNKRVITSGFHFGWDFIQAAIQCFENHIKDFEYGWYGMQVTLFFDKIFTTLLLRLSARDIHELVRGIVYYDESKPALRTFQLRDGTSIYSSEKINIGTDLLRHIRTFLMGWVLSGNAGFGADKVLDQIVSDKNNSLSKFINHSFDSAYLDSVMTHNI